jgi:hypothetical protein
MDMNSSEEETRLHKYISLLWYVPIYHTLQCHISEDNIFNAYNILDGRILTQ